MKDRYFHIHTCDGDGEYARTLDEMLYEYNAWKEEHKEQIEEDGFLMPQTFDEWFLCWYSDFDCYGKEITKEEYEQLKTRLNKED